MTTGFRTAERQAVIKLLHDWGLNAHEILADGHDRHGYERLEFDDDGKRKLDHNFDPITTCHPWPAGFPYEEFCRLVRLADESDRKEIDL